MLTRPTSMNRSLETVPHCQLLPSWQAILSPLNHAWLSHQIPRCCVSPLQVLCWASLTQQERCRVCLAWQQQDTCWTLQTHGLWQYSTPQPFASCLERCSTPCLRAVSVRAGAKPRRRAKAAGDRSADESVSLSALGGAGLCCFSALLCVASAPPRLC